jgi:hypothetical protein
LVVALRLETEGGDLRMARLGPRERILEENVESPLGGPVVRFERRDDQTTEACFDLLNPGQRVELRLTTIIERAMIALPSAMKVAARAEGLPPAVECRWDYDENAPPEPARGEREHRPGIVGWAGTYLYRVARWLVRVASRLATRPKQSRDRV